MKQHGLTYLFVLLLSAVLTACNHKDLYMEVDNTSMSVAVHFDYSQATDEPSAMRVVFYPIEGSSRLPIRFDLGASGGIVQLPVGAYRVLAFSVGTQNILEYQDDDYDAFYLSTLRQEITISDHSDKAGHRSIRRLLFGNNLPIGEDERPDYPLYETPDWTCVARQDHFQVKPLTTEQGADHVTTELSLSVVDAVKHLEFEVTGVKGVKYATLLRGTISGIPTAYQMSTGQSVGELGLMTFAASVDVEREVIVGTMNIWGFFPADDPEAHQYLNVYLWTNVGNFYVSQDVTDQMKAGQDASLQRITLHVESEGIDLTDAGAGDSGFKPSVGEWDEHSSSIQL